MIRIIDVLFLSMLFNAFALFIFILYPGAIKLAIAKFRKKNYCVILDADRVLHIDPANKDIGCYRNKNGVYEFSPDDIFSYNGVSSGLWYEAYNKAANPKVSIIITELKKMGVKSKAVLAKLANTKIETLDKDVQKIATDVQDNMGWILEPRVIVRLQDLFGYMQTRNPMIVEAMIEREVQKERYKQNNPIINLMPYVLMFLMLMLGAVVIFKFMGTGGTPSLPSVGPPISIK